MTERAALPWRTCLGLVMAFMGMTASATIADANSAAGEWLQRLSRSMSSLSYQGIVTYDRGDHLESLRITHGHVEGQLFERLEYLDGAERELILREGLLTGIREDRRETRAFGAVDWRQRWDHLAAYYDLSVVGEGRVADRSTVELALIPKDEYRLGRYLSLDRDTGLLLRSELVNADQQVLERLQFVAIDVDPGPGAAALAEVAPRPIGTLAKPGPREPESKGPASDMRWEAGWLPPGFTPASATAAAAMTYSDGLSVVSVFIDRSPTVDEVSGAAQRGATTAYTRSGLFGGQSWTVTVVGEVPGITARRIAEAVVLGNRS